LPIYFSALCIQWNQRFVIFPKDYFQRIFCYSINFDFYLSSINNENNAISFYFFYIAQIMHWSSPSSVIQILLFDLLHHTAKRNQTFSFLTFKSLDEICPFTVQ